MSRIGSSSGLGAHHDREGGGPMSSFIGLLAEVDVDASSEGLPGADLIQQLLDWAQMIALWASLGAILVGAAMYGLAREGGSYGAASKGKSFALGGVVGAILAG